MYRRRLHHGKTVSEMNMSLFSKKEIVYEAKGKKEQFKAVKEALKEAGIKCYSGSWEDEMPVCGCGGKLDVRDFGANGRIDRTIYTIRVTADQVEKASGILLEKLPDYKPYERGC